MPPCPPGRSGVRNASLGTTDESGRLPVIPARGNLRLPTLRFGGGGPGFRTHQLPPKATRPSADGAPGDRRALRQRYRSRSGRVATQAQVAQDPNPFGALRRRGYGPHASRSSGTAQGRPSRSAGPGAPSEFGGCAPGRAIPPLLAPGGSPGGPERWPELIRTQGKPPGSELVEKGGSQIVEHGRVCQKATQPRAAVEDRADGDPVLALLLIEQSIERHCSPSAHAGALHRLEFFVGRSSPPSS